MDNIELYKTLFLDSFSAGLFFTINYEYVIWVILLFKKLDNIFAIGIAALGYSVSIFFNYLFGFLLYKIFFKYLSKSVEERYIKTKEYSKKYIFFLVLLTAFKGAGKSIFILFGFLNLNIFFILIGGVFVKVIYYTCSLYYDI
jgi:membrane protein YqaA with SNARE-associated domain